MFFQTSLQGSAFLVFVFLGALCALAAQCSFMLQRLLPARWRVARCVLDALLAVLIGLLMVLVLFWTGQSAVRWYCVLGALCGALIYLFGPWRILRQAARGVFSACRRVRRSKDRAQDDGQNG